MQIEYKSLKIAHLPTPLEEATRLADALGKTRIFIKRDDATGLAGGGNKARKLEYLAAEALAQGANCLVTVGGPQSNHARMTAAVAARLGLKCRLYLTGQRPQGLRGNLLLDRLLGAELIFCGEVKLGEIYRQIEIDGEQLGKEGTKIYFIPLGGANPLGSLGYVRAITEELIPQCMQLDIKPQAIVTAAGSGGTMAGIMLGLALAGWDVPVWGYSVSAPAEYVQKEVAAIFNGASQLLGASCHIEPGQVLVDDSQIGPGYGIATPEALEALGLLARTEGLLLDSVYTAKAAAGMIAAIRQGQWQDNVVFFHTGGWPALFGKDDVESWLLKEE